MTKNIYDINYTEGVEWNDGTEWTPDGKGGYILPSTMCITDTLCVTEGYEGLGMILSPLTLDAMSDKSYGVHDEQEFFIREILEIDEGSILFDIMDIYKILNEDSNEDSAVDDESNKENSATNTETPKGNSTTTNSNNTTTNSGSSKDNTTPKQEQPTHTHSYTSSVTKNPTCSEEGVRTYTCSSCGASYTEAIAKVDHNWQSITESVYHPSTGHYETVTKKEAFCGCGASGFQSQAELNAHWESGCGGTTGGIREWTENVWVVDQPEYYSDEVTGYQCSVCGARQ